MTTPLVLLTAKEDTSTRNSTNFINYLQMVLCIAVKKNHSLKKQLAFKKILPANNIKATENAEYTVHL